MSTCIKRSSSTTLLSSNQTTNNSNLSTRLKPKKNNRHKKSFLTTRSRFDKAGDTTTLTRAVSSNNSSWQRSTSNSKLQAVVPRSTNWPSWALQPIEALSTRLCSSLARVRSCLPSRCPPLNRITSLSRCKVPLHLLALRCQELLTSTTTSLWRFAKIAPAMSRADSNQMLLNKVPSPRPSLRLQAFYSETRLQQGCLIIKSRQPLSIRLMEEDPVASHRRYHRSSRFRITTKWRQSVQSRRCCSLEEVEEQVVTWVLWTTTCLIRLSMEVIAAGEAIIAITTAMDLQPAFSITTWQIKWLASTRTPMDMVKLVIPM